MFHIYWPVTTLLAAVALIAVFLTLKLSKMCGANFAPPPERPLKSYLPDQVSCMRTLSVRMVSHVGPWVGGMMHSICTAKHYTNPLRINLEHWNTGLCNTLYVLKICHSLESFNGHKIAMSRVTYIHVVKACSNQALWNSSTHASWNWVSVWFAISEEWPRCPCLFRGHAVTEIRRSAPKPGPVTNKLPPIPTKLTTNLIV